MCRAESTKTQKRLAQPIEDKRLVKRAPAAGKTLRVVTTQTGSIDIYADSVRVYYTTSAVNPFATGAGLYNNGAGMGMMNRWDNFTVMDVP
jgi:hypothetical protein